MKKLVNRILLKRLSIKDPLYFYNKKKNFFEKISFSIYSKLNIHGDFLKSKVDRIEDCIKNYNLALHVNNVFEKYRAIYRNKTIAIFGCGPTLLKYKPLNDIDINISINRAFKLNNISFDYLFVNDELSEGLDEFLSYGSDSCEKFVGYSSNEPKYMVKHISSINYKINRFVLDVKKMNRIPYDITFNPIADLNGTVFCALQFALFTMPKKIYLIGFDCDGTTNIFADNSLNYSYQKLSWEMIKNFVEYYHSKIEICSVNPIGLKGMFEDIYI